MYFYEEGEIRGDAEKDWIPECCGGGDAVYGLRGHSGTVSCARRKIEWN